MQIGLKVNKNFKKDLIALYDLIGIKQKELGSFYGLIENEEYNNEKISRYVDEFLDECELENTKENYLALLSRLINLRDEQFIQTLLKVKNTQEEIEKKRALAYLWTKNFHIKRHEELLKEIEKRELLNKFYRELLWGIHRIGLILSDWQYEWNSYIINNINLKLREKYGEKVIEFLRENDLFQRDEDGNLTDRSYSVLVEKNGKYEIFAYAQFFGNYVDSITEEFGVLLKKLTVLDEDDTNQKENYLRYLEAVQVAFAEKDTRMLLSRWKEVDRAWMDITSPIQIGHPLEYYEDHYRKAVALEWDVRVSNPQKLEANRAYESILDMYNLLFKNLDEKYIGVKHRTEDNLKRVQLYIGRPALFYASEFNGLFSAQVVPNDEQVSKERGKKIFAFAQNILDTQRAKPFLKIDRVVFGEDFMKKERELIFKKEKIWHKVYEVSTIGHEFGHILWLDYDSEMQMNRSGVFKNIEEFKATTGGLVAFFLNEDEEIKEYVFLELIKRAIGLIAWREVGEVEPYYCEGLIHLQALFDSDVLEFNEKLSLHVENEKYEKLKNWYLKTYKELALHYLKKQDAKEFLDKFIYKKDGDYLPKDRNVEDFVEYYWALYQDIGREIDKTVDKKEWLIGA